MDKIFSYADPANSFQKNRTAILQKIVEVLDSGSYINGEQVDFFEKHFAQFCKTQHAVGVGNGTDAIELTLRALNIGPNQLVFTVSHTAVATVAAIERAGAIPVLIDIKKNTYTMCPQSLEEALSKAKKGYYPGKPGAIIPVHMYGCCADMDTIIQVAGDIPVIEDCAQAHGAQYKNRLAGSLGIAGTFSFYPTKNLGTYGDAGCIVTSDPSLAKRLKILREYGWEKRYISNFSGINTRLDEIHAGILNVLLPQLDKTNFLRRTLAQQYTNELKNILSITLPIEPMNRKHVYHLYVIQTKYRDALQKLLNDEYIRTAVHYPQPIHLQPAYSSRIHIAPKGLPETEKIYSKILSLPIHPGLSTKDILYIASQIKIKLSTLENTCEIS